jgi:hypothetical protein
MPDLPEDFLQGMPLWELEAFVTALSRQYGVTDAEMEEWRRLSPAERTQRLRALEEQLRRATHGPDAPAPGPGGPL